MVFIRFILLLSNIYVATSYDFILRPVFGSQNEGFVEMKVNGTWGIMSSRYSRLSDTTARMLCRHLGFGLRGFSTSSWVELELSNNVLWWGRQIHCDGSETDINECVQGTWTNNGHWVSTLYKGWTILHCFDFEVTDVRLYGGFVPHVGIFEVKVGSRWGSVGQYPDPTGTRESNAAMLCPLLGYHSITWRTMSDVELRDNLKPVTDVWMIGLRCIGTTNISDCSFNVGSNFPHSDGIYFRCEAAVLLNGTTANTGILLVGLFGHRKMICATSDFNVAAANVACNLLGHKRVASVSSVNISTDNIGDVFSGSIQCNGTEQSLEMCDVVEEQAECQDSSVVYIECFDGPMDILPIGKKTNEGVVTFTYYDELWLKKGDISSTTAKTFCNLLGHGFEGRVQVIAEIPEYIILSTEYSSFSSIECNGNETNISQCQKEVLFRDSCWRCVYPDPPSGYVLLYCEECQPGYYGTYCTECACNNRSTEPCDVHTGECTCMGGWSGTSCEIDVDECITTTCPINSNCTNTLGSYHCVCRQGYTLTDDVCRFIQYKECQPGYYGTYCTECACNNRSTEPCDVHTGECTCMSGWSGTSCEIDVDECITTTFPINSDCTNTLGSYQCVCRHGYTLNDDVCRFIQYKEDTAEQSNLLIIILASVIGGFVLICIIAIFCLCKYRRKGKSDKKEATHANRPGNEFTLSGTNKSEDYNTIDDSLQPGKQVITPDPYDTLNDASTPSSRNRNQTVRPELPVRPGVNPANVNRNDAKAMPGTKDYDYIYPPTLPTDDEGYLKVQNVHNVGSTPYDTNYQPLKPRNGQEHEYYSMKH